MIVLLVVVVVAAIAVVVVSAVVAGGVEGGGGGWGCAGRVPAGDPPPAWYCTSQHCWEARASPLASH